VEVNSSGVRDRFLVSGHYLPSFLAGIIPRTEPTRTPLFNTKAFYCIMNCYAACPGLCPENVGRATTVLYPGGGVGYGGRGYV